MVQTTKGGVAPKKPITAAPEMPTADDRKMKHLADLDDETWDRIVQMGASQSIDPAEVVRRAIVQAYGSAPTTGAYNSGNEVAPAP